jgi:hypothetical protein
MSPLIRVLPDRSTTLPASRSKRIVPSDESTFRSLAVTLAGPSASGSIL